MIARSRAAAGQAPAAEPHSCRRGSRAVQVLALMAALSGCDPNIFGPAPVDAGASPNASIVARPVVTTIAETPDAATDAGAPRPRDGGTADGGLRPPKPPQPFRADEVIVQEATRQREVAGIALEGRWSWAALPRAAETPETDAGHIEALVEEMARGWLIEITGAGRMRIDFETRGMPLAQGSALLARRGRYGHLLLWPTGRVYRVLPAGTLRTVLGELRADVTPLSTPSPQPQPDGKRLGLETKVTRLQSSYGDVLIEQAAIPEAGTGATLLCRTLVELVGVSPATEACLPGFVALAASYRWGAAPEGAPALRFEVSTIRRQLGQSGRRYAMAPRDAKRQPSGLPSVRTQLSNKELEGLRKTARAAPESLPPKAPKQGLEAFNGSDQLLWLFIDGLPVLAIAPYQTRTLSGLRNGRYSLQWRSYLGDIIGDAREQDIPARSTYGEAPEPADKPDAGP